MEFKLGSVWLLLSYSLQQSLLGILAIVPQINAKNCIGSNGEPVKRVPVIRRIPARCSGWEEAWSWASKTDCSTKYVYEYTELPSAGDADEDCENEQAASSEKDHFSVTEEKFLAIAFGSATVALLVLIVIIVISLLRRGQSRCSLCGGGPAYSSANRSERENSDQQGHVCNEYVDEGHRMLENVYEEIKDGNGTKAKLPAESETERKGFQTSQEYPVKEKSAMPVNGVSNGVVIPSAPYEEDLQQTTFVNSMPTQHSSITDSSVSNTSGDSDPKDQGFTEQKLETKDDDKERSDADKKCDGSRKCENVYSKFNDIVAHKKTDMEPVQPEAPLSPLSSDSDGKPAVLVSASHSYENLHPDVQCELNGPGYDSLIKSQSDSGLSLTCANDVDGNNFDNVRNGHEPSPEVLPLEDLNHTSIDGTV